MDNRHLHPPLTPLEKAMVDAFCLARPCQPLRAICAPPAQAEDREDFYAACRTICTSVHFCPLEGGLRYACLTGPAALPAAGYPIADGTGAFGAARNSGLRAGR